ncbi:unnamed protein product [Prunus armeniaca]
MHDNESLSAYLTRLNDMINQMKTYGEVLSNERLVQKVLISLSKIYDPICLVIENTKSLETVELQEVIAILKSEEQRFELHNVDATEKAFASFTVQKARTRVGNHGSQKESLNKTILHQLTILAHHSQQVKRVFGHLARECTAGKSVQKANCANQVEVIGNLFYANCATIEANPNGDWYIDSGCSNHMTNNVDLLVDVRTNVAGHVQMPTGVLVKVAGMGSLIIETTNGRKYIREVMYLPGLRENLLSVGQMDEHGYFLVFGDEMCKMFDSSSLNCLIIKVPMKKNRLGHLHFRGLKQLRDKDMVHGLPKLEEQNGVCEGCQFGKQHKNVFPNNQAQRVSISLELVHIDLCGPMRTESVAGNKYFMLIIDDFTRMIWLYFLRNKYEAFNCFKKFKSMTELQSRHKVKCLRSDRGGEFLSSEFVQFCEDHDIQRCPNKALNNVTPFEAYSGRKPGITHLKVFDSLCYVHVPNELRHNLELKSVKGVFVGYATCEKGYRIFDPISKKLTLSRDVAFDEEGSWNWTENSGKAVTPLLDENQSEHGFIIGDKDETTALTPQTKIRYERSPLSSQSPSQHISSDISSEERNTQAYDHSPLKWRRLDDVLA